MKSILTIAGSDPSGGAGIQADLKTITTLGCYGAAAITAITCQNTMGVSHCHPLPAKLVADHIKIGMTASAEIITTLAVILKDFTGEIIFDPVLKSSAGQSLLNADPISALSPLLARVSVLTPNIPELSCLSQLVVSDEDQALHAGKTLMERHSNIKALCIKGGHLHEDGQEVVDILMRRRAPGHDFQVSRIRHPRHQTRNSHGTGCTFASAFAAYHLHTDSYQKAFESAVSYVDTLLKLSKEIKIGKGRGPLLHHTWR